jgi:hypothetical protein
MSLERTALILEVVRLPQRSLKNSMFMTHSRVAEILQRRKKLGGHVAEMDMLDREIPFYLPAAIQRHLHLPYSLRLTIVLRRNCGTPIPNDMIRHPRLLKGSHQPFDLRFLVPLVAV